MVALPAYKELVVALAIKALVTVRLFINAFNADNVELKKLVELAASVIVKEVMVVVARVEVPITTKAPDVLALPLISTLKLRFSVHEIPFQYRVLFNTVPLDSAPETTVQNVDVPFVARN